MGLTEAFLQQMGDLTSWGIVTTDAQLIINGWNHWLEANGGTSASQVIGRNLLDVFPDLRTRKLERFYRQALSGQMVLLAQRLHGYILPLPLAAPAGGLSLMQQSARIAPLLEEGRIVGTVTFIEDVTERVDLEKQLRQRADDLAEEGRRKDEFLAMLSHELRNPLAPIRNAVEIISASAPCPTVEQATQIIDHQVQHMVHLVDDLLDVSRVSRGKIQLRKERTDLAAIVVRAVESVRPLIDKHKHELTLQLPPRPMWFDGDPTRLVQILVNLLNNAAKYTTAGGHIWLTVTREGNQSVWRIRDNGIGIRAELLPRIFDLFVQSDRGFDRAEGGLGIGLTLVRNLVEMHGGTVSASSNGLGQGSEFVVRLPTLPEAEEPSPPAPRDNITHHVPPSVRRRILIVDDNVDSAVTLAMLLQLQLHDVRVAYDGPAALEAVKTNVPEIVFLDIGLPRMDGYEVARRLRQEHGWDKLLIVAMTGYGQEEDRRRTQAAGFDGHLVKPIDPNVLEEFLKRRTPAAQDSAEE